MMRQMANAGGFTLRFSSYEEVPRDQAEKIVAAARAEKEAEARA